MRNFVTKTAVAAAALAVSLGGFAAPAGQVNMGVSISDGGLDSFYVAVGDHYRVSPQLVADYGTRYGLHDDELPVVFFLAARAQVAPRVVIDLRLGKRSWFDIAVHFGLSPEIFFVPVGLEKIGPPYGNAYGYYRKYGQAGDWRKFKPVDREVVDLVNLRFLSEYHGQAPEAIIGLRGRGESFVKIHEDVGREKAKSSQGKASHAKGTKGGQPDKGKKK